MDLIDKIKKIKIEKNAVILAHYYTLPEVQDIADFVGDSLALSREAANTDADIILFAGVHFMAETAKILSPEKKVLIPTLEAGCSLADSCRAEDLKEFLKKYPDHKVVSYVNTSVGVKALTDVVCTSSNAIQVINSIPKDEKIVFTPDRNLGNYIKTITGREDMVVWDGACHVHEQFSVERIIALKKEYPAAKLLAHPECKKVVQLLADYIGSTAGMLEFSVKDDAKEYIVATESGILHQMAKRNPEKTFIPAPPEDATCGCNNCSFMKLVNLENIYKSLVDECFEVTIDSELIERAKQPIVKMFSIR